MGGGSSGSSSPSTTTQTTQPWSGAEPYFSDIYSKAQGAYNQVNSAPYSGPVYAGPNANQTGANTQLLNLANSPALSTASNNEQGFLNNLTSGAMLDPASNPTLQKMIQATNQPIAQNFQQTIVPSINSAAIQSGAYGGARNGLALGRAAQGESTAIANADAGLEANNYNNVLGMMGNAPSMITGNLTNLTAPANIQSAVGGQQQGWSQDSINALINQYNANQLAPFTGLSNYAQLIGSGGGTSGTTQYSPQGPSIGSQLMQGAGSAAGIAMMLSMAFSDRRLKTNIKKIGEAHNGLPIYLFNYVGNSVPQIGFMADEVQKIHPDAVWEVGGYLCVNYSKAVV